MNTEQIEKAIQLCQDLQAHALNEIVKGVKAGERLGTKDLRLIQDIRKQLEAQRTFAKGDEEWLTLSDASKRLGVNVRTLQLWCSGKDALHQPPLPHKREGRTILLPIQVAHVHLTQHAKRLTLKSVAKHADALDSESEEPEEIEDGNLTARLESSLSRMHRGLVETPHGLRLYSQTLKILEEIKVRREAVERHVTADDAIKMLRSLGEIYCWHIEKHAPGLAKQIRKKVEEWCGVDIWNHNCAIEQLLEAETCIWGNTVLDAIKKCVIDQVEGVENLPGGNQNRPIKRWRPLNAPQSSQRRLSRELHISVLSILKVEARFLKQNMWKRANLRVPNLSLRSAIFFMGSFGLISRKSLVQISMEFVARIYFLFSQALDWIGAFFVISSGKAQWSIMRTREQRALICRDSALLHWPSLISRFPH